MGFRSGISGRAHDHRLDSRGQVVEPRWYPPRSLRRLSCMNHPMRKTIVKPNTDSLCYALVYRFSAIMVAAAAVLIVLTAL
jgi:hypothetical protein